MNEFVEILRIAPEFYAFTKKFIGEREVYMIGVPGNFNRIFKTSQEEILPIQQVLKIVTKSIRFTKRVIVEIGLKRRREIFRERLIHFAATEYLMRLLKQDLVKKYVGGFDLYKMEEVELSDINLIEEAIEAGTPYMPRKKTKNPPSQSPNQFLKVSISQGDALKTNRISRQKQKEAKTMLDLMESIRSVYNEQRKKCIPLETILSKLMEDNRELIITPGKVWINYS
jgi:hypothetical protein